MNVVTIRNDIRVIDGYHDNDDVVDDDDDTDEGNTTCNSNKL